jgi:hypothetical protein
LVATRPRGCLTRFPSAPRSQRVIDLDPKVSNSVLQFGVAEQDLDGRFRVDGLDAYNRPVTDIRDLLNY